MMTERVRHIQLSEKDEQYLGKIQQSTPIKKQDHPEHYRDKVVIKPWGYEFLMFENEYVAMWFLRIKKDHSTSMHCHPLKKTSLVLLSGKALCNTFHHRALLSAGEAVMIDAAVFHSTKALTLDGISVIEIESPPDKLDLVRLEDKYGRESCGYEDCSQMTMDNLKKFGHFYFDDGNCYDKKITMDNWFSISVDAYTSSNMFQETFNADIGTMYCVCKGCLLALNKNIIVDVGEVERGLYLEQMANVRIDQETMIMNFTIFS
ncbi:MAG: hypothetical protein ISS59_00200 [Desulfobacteraceae bacterium]|nr:hypothetical protein [Desulfobacteraceae bacterium]